MNNKQPESLNNESSEVEAANNGIPANVAALEDFMRVFRSSLNVSTLYSPGHPSFIKASEDLKNGVNAVLSAGSPFKLGITTDEIIISGKNFATTPFYKEIAVMLHQRKIKNIEFSSGITTEEIAVLLSRLALSSRDLVRQGGIWALLKNDGLKFIRLEELDYAALLKGGGREEIAQVWKLLLRDAVDKEDQGAINELIGEFREITRKLGVQQFLDDEETAESVKRFLKYLSLHDRKGFRECVGGVAETVLNTKVSDLDAQQRQKLKVFFDECSDDDFSAILSGQLLKKDDFDSLSLGLFSKLAEGRDHNKIASMTVDALRKKAASADGRFNKRIEKLFSSKDEADVPGAYRSSLMVFLKETTYGQAQLLDRKELEANYNYMILNLLMQESDNERAAGIYKQFASTWDKLVASRDYDFLRQFIWVIDSKRTAQPSLSEEIISSLQGLVVVFMEQAVWDDDPKTAEFIGKVHSSKMGADFYLRKIFEEEQFTPLAIKLFISLFPDKLEDFFGFVRSRSQDIGFVESLVLALGETDALLVSSMLETIYNSVGVMLKVRVLEAMRCRSSASMHFLLKVLREETEVSLKREVLLIIMEMNEGLQEASQELFAISSPWGSKNELLINNISAAQEAGFKPAAAHIEQLGRRPFFWNSVLRRKAREAVISLR